MKVIVVTHAKRGDVATTVHVDWPTAWKAIAADIRATIEREHEEARTQHIVALLERDPVAAIDAWHRWSGEDIDVEELHVNGVPRVESLCGQAEPEVDLEECADCGGSTALGTPDPHECIPTRVAVPGVFTPWAEVLCLECHGPTLRGRTGPAAKLTEYETRFVKRRPLDDEGVGACMKCQAEVCVRADVAALQAVGFALADLAWETALGWHLDQTGGMNAALAVHRDHGDEVVVYDSQSEGLTLTASLLDITKPDDERYDEVLDTSEDVPYGEPERLARWILAKLGIEVKL